MSADVYEFRSITEDMPSKSVATRMDPLEKNQIYIGPSQLDGMVFGEGLFAKRSIPGNYTANVTVIIPTTLNLFPVPDVLQLCL